MKPIARSFLSALVPLAVAAACGSSSGSGGSTGPGGEDAGTEGGSPDGGGGDELGFPHPETAGFHHAALVYEQPGDRTPEAFAPYVAWPKDGHPRAGQWLFDAFVFLAFKAPSGTSLDYGASTQADWEALLEGWFGRERGELGALDTAISATAAATSAEGTPMGPPPSARRVMLAMPWMNPAVTDFGDVDGDGRHENLALTEDRVRVAKWYAAKVRERFTARHYAHLDLWGLYFMREDILRDDEMALPGVTAAIRAEGLRTLWIPYYAAPGWDTWKALGFDVAILQPSYAFRAWLDGGRVTRSRLHAAADLARAKGLGIEIEARGEQTLPAERAMLRHYLADGAPERLGYQRGATAYFLGADIIEKAFRAPADPQTRAAYDELAAYVRGTAIPDPDPAPDFARTVSGDGRTLVARAEWGAPRDVRGVQIDLDDKPNAPWSGTALVRVRRVGSSAFEPAGWAVRGAPDRVAGPMRWQTLSVPVASIGLAAATAIEVELVSAPPSGATTAPVVRITPDADFTPRTDASLARGAAYSTRPGPPASSFPDSTPPAAPKLTDGLVSQGGWNTGRGIGWNRDPGEAAVVFDLGRARAVSRVRVYTQGGSDSAVNWPLNASVLLASDAPRVAPEGTGALPGLSALRGAAPVITGQQSTTNLDGYIEFSNDESMQARYVTLFTEVKGWALLTEVQIEADGATVANVPYAIRTYPSSSSAPTYTDDARRLTDGIVATSFLPALLSGWSAATDVRVDVNLANDTVLHDVTVWSQSSGGFGIDAPATIHIEASADGSTFTSLGDVKAENAITAGAARGYRVSVSTPFHARALRIGVPAHGAADRWTMLSEIDAR